MSSQLIESLCRPGVLHPLGHVEVVETHISYVLLTGTYAYKIKKPVDFGFVDFTKLSKRRRFCHAELELNSRLAPDIYLEVVDITGSVDDPKMGGDGKLINAAVKMKQFPRDQVLNNLVLRSKDLSPYFKEFARRIAKFHNKIRAATPNRGYATLSSLKRSALNNFNTLKPIIRDRKTDRSLARLEAWTNYSLDSLVNIFQERQMKRRIRECHGDMHLGNLVLIDGHVIPFDCLEYNESFRWIDVADEMAFLLMDLCAHDKYELARLTLNYYLEASGDYAMIRLLNHYMVYRAMVRAKVALLSESQLYVNQALPADFYKYLATAENISNRKEKQLLIITHGLSGSGKSWVTEKLLKKADVIRIRSDAARRKLYGVGARQACYDNPNSDPYSEKAKNRVYRILAKQVAIIMDAGFPVIVDATFLRKSDRGKFQKIASDRKAAFHILRVEAPPSVISMRITTRLQDQNNVSDATLSVLSNQQANIEELDKNEKRYSISVDTNIAWTDSNTEAILEDLELVEYDSTKDSEMAAAKFVKA